MLTSNISAWIATALLALCAATFLVNRLGTRNLKKSFSKSHVIIGTIAILFALVHSILAGNPVGTDLSNAMFGSMLLTLSWGTACLVTAALLGLSYVFRKKIGKNWMNIHRILTVLFIAFLVIHVINVGIHLGDNLSLLFSEKPETSATVSSALPESKSTYSSEIMSSAEPGSESSATSETKSSDTSEQVSESSASSSSDSSSSGIVSFSGAVLKDGVYEGSAEGHEGQISVSVTVSGGAVTDITVTSQNETPAYYSRAETLLDTILNGQTLEVDAVTGATWSSAGLVNAVANALQGAVESGDLQVNSITPTGGHK
jgi:uncharacterized protein with FMN-binding domain